jgi:hypothetical protein
MALFKRETSDSVLNGSRLTASASAETSNSFSYRPTLLL